MSEQDTRHIAKVQFEYELDEKAVETGLTREQLVDALTVWLQTEGACSGVRITSTEIIEVPPATTCPACAAKRLHLASEREQWHPAAGEGKSKEHGAA